MSVIVTEFAQQTLDVKGFCWLATVSDTGRPEMTRVFGYTFDEPSLKFTGVVYAGDSDKVLACMEKNSKASLVVGDPLSMNTIQLKGEYIHHRVASDEEVAVVIDVFRPAQSAMMQQWGMPENIMNIWQFQPALAIEITIKEIFDQTPRQNTGNKIS